MVKAEQILFSVEHGIRQDGLTCEFGTIENGGDGQLRCTSLLVFKRNGRPRCHHCTRVYGKIRCCGPLYERNEHMVWYTVVYIIEWLF